jgi:hypothetical protein
MSLWSIKCCGCGCGTTKFGSDYKEDYEGDTEEEQQFFLDSLFRDGWGSAPGKAEDIEADDDCMITERCPACMRKLANNGVNKDAQGAAS